MGHENTLRSLQQLTESTVEYINGNIRKIDWDKKFRAEYPDSNRAKEVAEDLKKSDVKESLREVFSEQSLALSRLGEAF